LKVKTMQQQVIKWQCQVLDHSQHILDNSTMSQQKFRRLAQGCLHPTLAQRDIPIAHHGAGCSQP